MGAEGKMGVLEIEVVSIPRVYRFIFSTGVYVPFGNPEVTLSGCG